MAKKKKPMWPIYLGVVILLGCVAIVLTDWERYPTAVEMENYLEAQHSDVEKIEVTKVYQPEKAYEESQVYELKYTYSDGREEEHSYTIKKRDQKAVFPWHDYYGDQYPNKAHD